MPILDQYGNPLDLTNGYRTFTGLNVSPPPSYILDMSLLWPQATWLHGTNVPTTASPGAFSLSSYASQFGPPQFGSPNINTSDNWGSPIQTVRTKTNSYSYYTFYDDPSYDYVGLGGGCGFVYPNGMSCPIPTGGFRPLPSSQSDGALTVMDLDTGDYWDFWTLVVDGAGMPIPQSSTVTLTFCVFGNHLNTGRIRDARGYYQGPGLNGGGWPGTTGLHSSKAAGAILPGELDTINGINHAIVCAIPPPLVRGGNGYYFSSIGDGHTDGNTAGAPCQEGAMFFIPKSVNIAALSGSVAVKAIMTACQNYGCMLVDRSSNLAFYSSIPLAQLPADFRNGLSQIPGLWWMAGVQ